MDSKRDIRQIFRELRSGLSPEAQMQAAQQVALLLENHPLFKNNQHIACYLAYQHELYTQPVIEAIWRAGKQCYLPVLTEAKSLEFAHYAAGDELVPNQYGILEPETAARKCPPEQLELVLLPLLAFDLNGVRLGTGGGYYDRTFAFLHSNPEKRPVMMGLAYARQQAFNLPKDPWDIQLDGVITEQEVLVLSPVIDLPKSNSTTP